MGLEGRLRQICGKQLANIKNGRKSPRGSFRGLILCLVETGEGRTLSYRTVQTLIKERRALGVEFRDVG